MGAVQSLLPQPGVAQPHNLKPSAFVEAEERRMRQEEAAAEAAAKERAAKAQAAIEAREAKAAIAELKAAFSKYDKNGDGTISVDELVGVMKSLDKSTSTRSAGASRRLPTEDETRKWIEEEVDADGDGTVDFHEFCSFMEKQADAGDGGASALDQISSLASGFMTTPTKKGKKGGLTFGPSSKISMSVRSALDPISPNPSAHDGEQLMHWLTHGSSRVTEYRRRTKSATGPGCYEFVQMYFVAALAACVKGGKAAQAGENGLAVGREAFNTVIVSVTDAGGDLKKAIV
jgi:hypothetical protein